ncbi:MAG: XdhC family protein [Cyanobacteria bacterium P01_A01_bin.37]
MTIDFYQRLQDWLSGHVVAIATVIQVNGSTPREVSAKMLIRVDGEIFGTIGGGAGEAKIIRYARQLLRSEFVRDEVQSCDPSSALEIVSERFPSVRPNSLHKGRLMIDLTGLSQRETQGVCGGTMQVWVECWYPDWGLAIASQIVQALREGRVVTLVTPLTHDRVPFIDDHDHQPSHVEKLNERFVEHIHPAPTLLIIGAGHVGQALAQASQFSGFQVVIYDDRPEFLGSNRFSEETKVLSGAIALALSNFWWPQNLYLALVTRGVASDVETLTLLMRYVAEQPVCYIGMIGSKQRIRHVFQRIQEHGADAQFITSIHAPIGLDIGALTPEEIAISICAEMIQVKRKRLSQRRLSKLSSTTQ